MRIGVSQNGWPVYDETSHFVRTKVQGVGFWSANADVAYVLDHFTEQFHRRIESINLPADGVAGKLDDWSYAVRPVRGQTSGYSNHGSATARDINATRHPRGKHNTYSAAKRGELRKLVNEYEGVLRHGEFYTGTIDGMHVEINDNISAARVKQLANKLRARVIAGAAREDDVAFTDKHKLTKADVAAYGMAATEVGKEKSYDELLRFSPADARIRREMLAAFKAQSIQLAAQ